MRFFMYYKYNRVLYKQIWEKKMYYIYYVYINYIIIIESITNYSDVKHNILVDKNYIFVFSYFVLSLTEFRKKLIWLIFTGFNKL